MNVFFVKFGMFWYTIGTVIVCMYIRRVALPLAKTLPKTGWQLYFWCVYMDEHSRVALCVNGCIFFCSQPLDYSNGCYFVQKVCIII